MANKWDDPPEAPKPSLGMDTGAGKAINERIDELKGRTFGADQIQAATMDAASVGPAANLGQATDLARSAALGQQPSVAALQLQAGGEQIRRGIGAQMVTGRQGAGLQQSLGQRALSENEAALNQQMGALRAQEMAGARGQYLEAKGAEAGFEQSAMELAANFQQQANLTDAQFEQKTREGNQQVQVALENLRLQGDAQVNQMLATAAGREQAAAEIARDIWAQELQADTAKRVAAKQAEGFFDEDRDIMTGEQDKSWSQQYKDWREKQSWAANYSGAPYDNYGSKIDKAPYQGFSNVDGMKATLTGPREEDLRIGQQAIEEGAMDDQALALKTQADALGERKAADLNDRMKSLDQISQSIGIAENLLPVFSGRRADVGQNLFNAAKNTGVGILAEKAGEAVPGGGMAVSAANTLASGGELDERTVARSGGAALGSSAGTAIGTSVGGPVGGAFGGALGSQIGGFLGGEVAPGPSPYATDPLQQYSTDPLKQYASAPYGAAPTSPGGDIPAPAPKVEAGQNLPRELVAQLMRDYEASRNKELTHARSGFAAAEKAAEEGIRRAEGLRRQDEEKGWQEQWDESIRQDREFLARDQKLSELRPPGGTDFLDPEVFSREDLETMLLNIYTGQSVDKSWDHFMDIAERTPKDRQAVERGWSPLPSAARRMQDEIKENDFLFGTPEGHPTEGDFDFSDLAGNPTEDELNRHLNEYLRQTAGGQR